MTEVSGSQHDIEEEVQRVRSYLMQSIGATERSIYEQLVDAVGMLLQTRRCPCPDDLRDLLRDLSVEKLVQPDPPFQSAVTRSEAYTHARTVKELLSEAIKRSATFMSASPSSNHDRILWQDLLEVGYYFELAGVGLGQEEFFKINIALNQLAAYHRLRSCRFWGKVFGTEADYIIAEVELDLAKTDLTVWNNPVSKEIPGTHGINQGDVEADSSHPAFETDFSPRLPSEPLGEGCNLNSYFVCSEPGSPWTLLPNVSPEQIVAARRLRKIMTGRLDNMLVSYPVFPGKEMHYLRAQIARISAGTHISPAGYYVLDDDGDDLGSNPDEGESPQRTAINEEYEPFTISELTDPSLSNWVHHRSFILNQGRCIWARPLTRQHSTAGRSGNPEDEGGSDEDDDEEIEPEVGPALMNPISEDDDVDGNPAWTAFKFPSVHSQHSVALLRSLRWTGSYAFSRGQKVDNIYIGWALPYSPDPFSPTLPPPLAKEHAFDTALVEANDPTAEEERAYQLAMQERRPDDDDDDQDESEEESD